VTFIGVDPDLSEIFGNGIRIDNDNETDNHLRESFSFEDVQNSFVPLHDPLEMEELRNTIEKLRAENQSLVNSCNLIATNKDENIQLQREIANLQEQIKNLQYDIKDRDEQVNDSL